MVIHEPCIIMGGALSLSLKALTRRGLICALNAGYWTWHDSCTIKCGEHAFRLTPEDAEIVRAYMIGLSL